MVSKPLPREDEFLDLFERHSVTLVTGAALQKIFQGGDDVAWNCQIAIDK
jgi:hypothetical protein